MILGGYYEEDQGSGIVYPFIFRPAGTEALACMPEEPLNTQSGLEEEFGYIYDATSTDIAFVWASGTMQDDSIKTSLEPFFIKKTLCNVVATSEVSKNGAPVFSLYPNPASADIAVELYNEQIPLGAVLQIEIYDLLGRKHYSMPADPYSTNLIPAGTLQPGCYIASHVANAKILQTLKLVVIHIP